MNTLQEELKIKNNLSTYYILPLLKLNMKSWGEDTFIKSQVTKFGEVVVFIKNDTKVDYYNHDNFAADVEEDQHIMVIYNIPTEFLEDYQMFLESKFSKMSNFAKDLIYSHAKANGLKWNIPTGKFINVNRGGITISEQTVFSDAKLLALSLNADLKNQLEKDLDIKIPIGAELMSKLQEKEFINLS
jgi:hypothetical protein